MLLKARRHFTRNGALIPGVADTSPSPSILWHWPHRSCHDRVECASWSIIKENEYEHWSRTLVRVVVKKRLTLAMSCFLNLILLTREFWMWNGTLLPADGHLNDKLYIRFANSTHDHLWVALFTQHIQHSSLLTHE